MMLLRAEPRCTTAIQTLKNKNAVMLNIIITMVLWKNLLNPMNIFGIIFMKIMANDGRTLLLYLSFLCEGYI